MRSAIDTNVISAFWAREPASNIAEDMLLTARELGGMVICGPVYSELLAHPQMSADFLDSFLSKTGIDLDFELGKDIWQQAGERFSLYAQRRKKSIGSKPKRLLTDFIIGAHAVLRADRLVTFNTADYRVDFPELTLTDGPG